ncbi:helix-turn-helix transcriptional regulator [Streptomyces sp. XM4193]|uniref:response regulator transcription factor n=1 Tax=Streptomyces sp. XM4193 TaxID=2929782 RepID=UPI001FF9FA04|nr:helix-turn-helix transcriptional regulator [Streptomyces sp. XM4193]MCK1798971.1 helix-turn-helix transcriptional regulator [Streptomyces sp. XM4193]
MRVYTWVLRNRSLRTDVAMAELEASREEVTDSIQRLLDAHLVYRSPDDPAVGFARAPETALARRAAPHEARIRRHQDQLALYEEELAGFWPSYEEHRPPDARAFEVINSLEEVRASLNRASDECRTEMISSQPGGGYRVPEAMEEAIARDSRLLERGVSIRTLYHHTARFNAPSQAYVAAASALGGQYRTAHALFGRLIVFDRTSAYIPLQDESWGAVVIREPDTVGYLCDVFEQTWDTATPFADAASEGLEQVSRQVDETILRLLATGLKDETVARRLGMSLRTVRRHIAEIMEELNATSRFQAGVTAALNGLVGAADSEQHKHAD